jgi:intracellular sulfur oxidation DsrE/DsrF family protein
MLTLLLNQLAEDIQIEAVLHGKGLGLLLRKSSAMRDRLKQAAASGVKSPNS